MIGIQGFGHFCWDTIKRFKVLDIVLLALGDFNYQFYCKVTMEAQLGLIGGTMGLLTGFSILSGVEIIYYLLRIVLEQLTVMLTLFYNSLLILLFDKDIFINRVPLH